MCATLCRVLDASCGLFGAWLLHTRWESTLVSGLLSSGVRFAPTTLKGQSSSKHENATHLERTPSPKPPSCKLRTRRGWSVRAPGSVRRLQRPLETNASWGRVWDTRRAERWRGGRGRSGCSVPGVCEWLSLMFPFKCPGIWGCLARHFLYPSPTLFLYETGGARARSRDD